MMGEAATDIPSLRPRDAYAVLRGAVLASEPAFLWGAPGIGKSDIVRQLATELGHRLVEVRGVVLDPVDLRGLPWLQDDDEKKITRWAPPGFLPRDDEPTILFLDELAQAPLLVMNALLGLILDRRLGEFTLPDSVRVVAASNRQSDRAGANRITSALASRFGSHIEMVPDTDDWLDWALGAGICPEVRGYLRYMPQVLMGDDYTTSRAYACPRTWAKLSALQQALKGAGQGVLFQAAASCVGLAAASGYTAFARLYGELPDPDTILGNPLGATVPTDPPVIYATSGMLIEQARSKGDDKGVLSSIIAYALRLPIEYQVLTLRDLVSVRRDTIRLPEIQTWLRSNRDLMLGERQ